METPPEDHFTPANHKLISVYLRRRVAGEPLPSAAAAYFHDIDIYTADPAALTAGLLPLPATKGEGSSWLFFTPVKTRSSTDGRRSRRVGAGGLGTWHSEHAPEAVIDGEGNRVGHRQLFSFKDKSGKRSGWSMWEFAADQEGGETLMVLCKIHQGHAGSRRADRSAARSARKRKCTDDGVAKLAPAPVKRRLFVPPTPTPPAASEDEIVATWEAICSTPTKTQTLLVELDAVMDAVPMFGDETGASKGTPRSMMSFLMPEPEAIPSSRTETEDAPRSVMVVWDEAYHSQPDKMSAPSSSHGSFSPKPIAPWEWEDITSSTVESPVTFLTPEPQASQGEMATFNCGFLMDSRAPSAPECESFTDGSGLDVSGVTQSALGEISGSWIRYDLLLSNCSVGNAFLGGFPTYGQCGAGSSASLAGYDNTASCSGNNGFIGALPTYSSSYFSHSQFTGVHYGCGLPYSTFLPLQSCRSACMD